MQIQPTRETISAGKENYPRQAPPSFERVAERVFWTSLKVSLVGGLLGAGLGAWRGRSPRSTFILASLNLACISIPFLSTREGFLAYRRFVNKQRGLDDNLVRNKDAMISTAASSVINGGMLALHLRGRWAIVGGAVVYSLVGVVCQFAVSIGRRWRQNHALERVIGVPKMMLDPYAIVVEPAMTVEERMSPHNDPMNVFFILSRDIIKEYIIGSEFPTWASPFYNALDPGYHDELNVRKEILNAQIDVLEREINNKQTIR